ncbi:palmitoyl-protein thioesterase 1-like [Peromyscus leucopus]|uniref:palmitoyl-protein thioesterase 1-like n=1 Tax=Peromyscus leucopus TaxID=10041 RepID=UPI001884BDA7|nr:palmitoyl-protein thioesterase 1-like [Peromyscus leucopus]
MMAEVESPRIHFLPQELWKNVKEDMENKDLNATSQMCELLAKDPKFQQGYIAVTFSTGVLILKRCPITPLKGFALYGR